MTINHFLAKISSNMPDSFQKKCDQIKKIFAPQSTEERYKTLIDLGRKLPPFSENHKTADQIVPGCQSTLYLYAFFEEGKLFFEAYSDALISAGLAALLIAVYSGETPETILKSSPDFIRELGIHSSLSINRSNGLANIYLKIKQEALKILVATPS